MIPHYNDIPKLTALCEAQNWKCCYCGIYCAGVGYANDTPTVEHVIAKRDGGKRHWSNEVMACRLCNNARDRMPAERYMEIVRLWGRERAAEWGLSKSKPHTPRRRRTIFVASDGRMSPRLYKLVRPETWKKRGIGIRPQANGVESGGSETSAPPW